MEPTWPSASTEIVHDPSFGALDNKSSFSYFPFTNVTFENSLILLFDGSVIVMIVGPFTEYGRVCELTANNRN